MQKRIILLLISLSCCLLATGCHRSLAHVLPRASKPSALRALVIYARDHNDHYPFPSKKMRNSIYERISDFYETMSYGALEITFKEATNNGGYFVSDHAMPFYKTNYDPKRHVRGFGMFNEEILKKVKAQKGDAFFEDVDMIMMVGTDGGPEWYTRVYNATGFAMLGVDFRAGGKTFGKSQRQGGITVEIGSDIGTIDPDDDRLYTMQEIYWVFAHETGHWLGLGHRDGKLGIYALMCMNLQSNERMPEFGPAPLDILQIIHLGWLDESDSTRVRVIRRGVEQATVTLNQVRSRTGLVLARLDLPGGEKVYISYHRRDADRFDGAYLGEGLLIWRRRGGRLDLISANREKKSQERKTGFAGGSRGDFVGAKQDFEMVSPPTRSGLNRGKNLQQETRERFRISNVREKGDQITFEIHLE